MLAFFLGMNLGGVIGVGIMCLFQINRGESEKTLQNEKIGAKMLKDK